MVSETPTTPAEDAEPSIRLAAIAAALRRGDAAPEISVREFLWWWKAARRGYWVSDRIRKALAEAGIHTDPDFESTYLNATLTFRSGESAPTAPPSGDRPTEVPATKRLNRSPLLVPSVEDPTYRISKLEAANHSPLCIRPDSTLIQATTLMMANDYSQLPVMTSEREVKGIVNWRTIGMRAALGQRPSTAAEIMEPHAEISSDVSIFGALPVIVQHQYVLVRAQDKRIVGIVTTSDLSLQFQSLAEPFLLLGEIENHLRSIIDARFSSVDLEAARDPADAERVVQAAADLTFGEYRRLLEEPSRWATLNLAIDRRVFLELIDKVRAIRNDVMHFDPDGIAPSDLHVLRQATLFLQQLRKLGVV